MDLVGKWIGSPELSITETAILKKQFTPPTIDRFWHLRNHDGTRLRNLNFYEKMVDSIGQPVAPELPDRCSFTKNFLSQFSAARTTTQPGKVTIDDRLKEAFSQFHLGVPLAFSSLWIASAVDEDVYIKKHDFHCHPAVQVEANRAIAMSRFIGTSNDGLLQFAALHSKNFLHDHSSFQHQPAEICLHGFCHPEDGTHSSKLRSMIEHVSSSESSAGVYGPKMLNKFRACKHKVEDLITLYDFFAGEDGRFVQYCMPENDSGKQNVNPSPTEKLFYCYQCLVKYFTDTYLNKHNASKQVVLYANIYKMLLRRAGFFKDNDDFTSLPSEVRSELIPDSVPEMHIRIHILMRALLPVPFNATSDSQARQVSVSLTSRSLFPSPNPYESFRLPGGIHQGFFRNVFEDVDNDYGFAAEYVRILCTDLTTTVRSPKDNFLTEDHIRLLREKAITNVRANEVSTGMAVNQVLAFLMNKLGQDKDLICAVVNRPVTGGTKISEKNLGFWLAQMRHRILALIIKDRDLCQHQLCVKINQALGKLVKARMKDVKFWKKFACGTPTIDADPDMNYVGAYNKYCLGPDMLGYELDADFERVMESQKNNFPQFTALVFNTKTDRSAYGSSISKNPTRKSQPYTLHFITTLITFLIFDEISLKTAIKVVQNNGARPTKIQPPLRDLQPKSVGVNWIIDKDMELSQALIYFSQVFVRPATAACEDFVLSHLDGEKMGNKLEINHRLSQLHGYNISRLVLQFSHSYPVDETFISTCPSLYKLLCAESKDLKIPGTDDRFCNIPLAYSIFHLVMRRMIGELALKRPDKDLPYGKPKFSMNTSFLPEDGLIRTVVNTKLHEYLVKIAKREATTKNVEAPPKALNVLWCDIQNKYRFPFSLDGSSAEVMSPELDTVQAMSVFFQASFDGMPVPTTGGLSKLWEKVEEWKITPEDLKAFMQVKKEKEVSAPSIPITPFLQESEAKKVDVQGLEEEARLRQCALLAKSFYAKAEFLGLAASLAEKYPHANLNLVQADLLKPPSLDDGTTKAAKGKGKGKGANAASPKKKVTPKKNSASQARNMVFGPVADDETVAAAEEGIENFEPTGKTDAEKVLHYFRMVADSWHGDRVERYATLGAGNNALTAESGEASELLEMMKNVMVDLDTTEKIDSHYGFKADPGGMDDHDRGAMEEEREEGSEGSGDEDEEAAGGPTKEWKERSELVVSNLTFELEAARATVALQEKTISSLRNKAAEGGDLGELLDSLAKKDEELKVFREDPDGAVANLQKVIRQKESALLSQRSHYEMTSKTYYTKLERTGLALGAAHAQLDILAEDSPLTLGRSNKVLRTHLTECTKQLQETRQELVNTKFELANLENLIKEKGDEVGWSPYNTVITQARLISQLKLKISQVYLPPGSSGSPAEIAAARAAIAAAHVPPPSPIVGTANTADQINLPGTPSTGIGGGGTSSAFLPAPARFNGAAAAQGTEPPATLATATSPAVPGPAQGVVHSPGPGVDTQATSDTGPSGRGPQSPLMGPLTETETSFLSPGADTNDGLSFDDENEDLGENEVGKNEFSPTVHEEDHDHEDKDSRGGEDEDEAPDEDRGKGGRGDQEGANDQDDEDDEDSSSDSEEDDSSGESPRRQTAAAAPATSTKKNSGSAVPSSIRITKPAPPPKAPPTDGSGDNNTASGERNLSASSQPPADMEEEEAASAENPENKAAAGEENEDNTADGASSKETTDPKKAPKKGATGASSKDTEDNSADGATDTPNPPKQKYGTSVATVHEANADMSKVEAATAADRAQKLEERRKATEEKKESNKKNAAAMKQKLGMKDKMEQAHPEKTGGGTTTKRPAVASKQIKTRRRRNVAAPTAAEAEEGGEKKKRAADAPFQFMDYDSSGKKIETPEPAGGLVQATGDLLDTDSNDDSYVLPGVRASTTKKAPKRVKMNKTTTSKTKRKKGDLSGSAEDSSSVNSNIQLTREGSKKKKKKRKKGQTPLPQRRMATRGSPGKGTPK